MKIEDKKHLKTDTADSLEDKKSERRAFFKKAAYAAPTLLALGALTRPTDAKADLGTPPSSPEWP